MANPVNAPPLRRRYILAVTVPGGAVLAKPSASSLPLPLTMPHSSPEVDV